MVGGLADCLSPGGLWLTLAGNANDPHRDRPGPPRHPASTLCSRIEERFSIVEMREFSFHGIEVDGETYHPLAWSILSRRR